jgi:hypothetical protein
MQSPFITANFRFIKVDYKLDSDVKVNKNEHNFIIINAFKARADV